MLKMLQNTNKEEVRVVSPPQYTFYLLFIDPGSTDEGTPPFN